MERPGMIVYHLTEEDKKRIKLNTAAPDLLKALKDALEDQRAIARYYETYCAGVGLSEANERIERSEAAIKKAYGQ